MATQTVADIMVEVLQQAGAKRCYGIPGDTLNYFTDSVRRSTMRWVHVRHEEVGGFAAGADSLLTGELTLCAGSCGPGSLHFINGLYESHRNRAPVVLIASQIVRDELGFNFPQEVDFKQVYAGCSVFCEEIRTPSQARRKTAMAAQDAIQKRGVAVLIVPADVSSASAPDEPAFSTHITQPITVPNPHELQRMADLINQGEKIAIYGGAGCEQAHAQVMQLAERLLAPVAHTSRAKDFLAHHNLYDVGMTGIFGNKGGYETLLNCDTLVLLGCNFAWRDFYPENATIIQIDIDGTQLGLRHPVNLGVVGDIPHTIDALLPLLSKRTDRTFLEQSLSNAQVAMQEQAKRAVPTAHAITPQYVTQLLSDMAQPDAIFTADAGSPMVWCLRHIASNGQNRTVISLSHGTMANAMPQALGAQAAYPQRQVIAMSGDGGLSMLLGDLLTTIQEKLPIKIVVFNNSALDFVQLEQKAEGLLDIYTDLTNPDFSKVANAIGLWGMRVEQAAQLPEAMQQWLQAPGPALLDVVTDRFEPVMPPTTTTQQVYGMALYSAKAVLAGRGQDVFNLVSNVLKA